MRVCRQGEVRFCGLRRVENLFAYSEAPASWATQSAVACTGQRIAASAASSAHYIAQTITTASGRTLAARFSLRAGGAVCLGIAGRRQQLCPVRPAGRRRSGRYIGHRQHCRRPDAAGYWLCSYRLAAAATSAVCALGPSGAAAPSMLGDGVTRHRHAQRTAWRTTSQSIQDAGNYVPTGLPCQAGGPNLLTNGSFASDLSGWTQARNPCGRMACYCMSRNDTASTTKSVYQAFATTPGKEPIKLSFNIPQGQPVRLPVWALLPGYDTLETGF